jgi:hypothetical protein
MKIDKWQYRIMKSREWHENQRINNAAKPKVEKDEKSKTNS